MWILRFLNGPLAGQVVPLTKNSTLIGRAPNCDIKIPNANVSKEHTRIEIFDDKVIVTDGGSRNGTFVNGVQIRSSKARSGDKIGIHDIFIEVQKVAGNMAAHFQHQYPGAYNHPAVYGNVAYQAHPQQAGAPHEDPAEADIFEGRLGGWAASFQAYLERVALPTFYRLPELFEFKWVLAGLMLAFILVVTSLSTIPLMRILKASIEEESQQHALTIATTLARVNRPALSQGLDTAVSVEIATSRPGVKKAFIISNIDGNVIAPATQAGTYPDLTYVHEGRKLNKESVSQIDDNTVVALVPIDFYNSETGTHAVTAWSVVLYDMGSLAVDNAQVLSLFITTLFIAMLIGIVLFFVLYKIVEHPIRNMNQQLDTALKEGHETVQVNYQFPALQLLASNVSSALTRAVNGSGDSAANRVMEHDRNREATNLVELIGFAAMAVRAADLSIAAVNQAFESRVSIPAAQLTTLSVNELNDQALKLSVKDLIERVDQNPDSLATNDLEFSGLQFQVVAQSVFGSAKISYYLIVLLPVEVEG